MNTIKFQTKITTGPALVSSPVTVEPFLAWTDEQHEIWLAAIVGAAGTPTIATPVAIKQRSYFTPSLLSFEGKVYLAYVEQTNNSIMIGTLDLFQLNGSGSNTFQNGHKFTPGNNLTVIAAPLLVNVDGHLVLAWTGSDNHIYYNTKPLTSGSGSTLFSSIKTKSAPASDGSLFMWSDMNAKLIVEGIAANEENGQVSLIESSPLTYGFSIPPSSPLSPALATEPLGPGTFVCYVNANEGNKLYSSSYAVDGNAGAAAGNTPTLLSDHESNFAPAVCFFQELKTSKNYLIVAWKGTDNANDELWVYVTKFV
jgi:hypothetical protein